MRRSNRVCSFCIHLHITTESPCAPGIQKITVNVEKAVVLHHWSAASEGDFYRPITNWIQFTWAAALGERESRAARRLQLHSRSTAPSFLPPPLSLSPPLNTGEPRRHHRLPSPTAQLTSPINRATQTLMRSAICAESAGGAGSSAFGRLLQQQL